MNAGAVIGVLDGVLTAVDFIEKSVNYSMSLYNILNPEATNTEITASSIDNFSWDLDSVQNVRNSINSLNNHNNWFDEEFRDFIANESVLRAATLESTLSSLSKSFDWVSGWEDIEQDTVVPIYQMFLQYADYKDMAQEDIEELFSKFNEAVGKNDWSVFSKHLDTPENPKLKELNECINGYLKNVDSTDLKAVLHSIANNYKTDNTNQYIPEANNYFDIVREGANQYTLASVNLFNSYNEDLHNVTGEERAALAKYEAFFDFKNSTHSKYSEQDYINAITISAMESAEYMEAYLKAGIFNSKEEVIKKYSEINSFGIDDVRDFFKFAYDNYNNELGKNDKKILGDIINNIDDLDYVGLVKNMDKMIDIYQVIVGDTTDHFITPQVLQSQFEKNNKSDDFLKFVNASLLKAEMEKANAAHINAADMTVYDDENAKKRINDSMKTNFENPYNIKPNSHVKYKEVVDISRDEENELYVAKIKGSDENIYEFPLFPDPQWDRPTMDYGTNYTLTYLKDNLPQELFVKFFENSDISELMQNQFSFQKDLYMKQSIKINDKNISFNSWSKLEKIIKTIPVEDQKKIFDQNKNMQYFYYLYKQGDYSNDLKSIHEAKNENLKFTELKEVYEGVNGSIIADFRDSEEKTHSLLIQDKNKIYSIANDFDKYISIMSDEALYQFRTNSFTQKEINKYEKSHIEDVVIQFQDSDYSYSARINTYGDMEKAFANAPNVHHSDIAGQLGEYYSRLYKFEDYTNNLKKVKYNLFGFYDRSRLPREAVSIPPPPENTLPPLDSDIITGTTPPVPETPSTIPRPANTLPPPELDTMPEPDTMPETTPPVSETPSTIPRPANTLPPPEPEIAYNGMRNVIQGFSSMDTQIDLDLATTIPLAPGFTIDNFQTPNHGINVERSIFMNSLLVDPIIPEKQSITNTAKATQETIYSITNNKNIIVLNTIESVLQMLNYVADLIQTFLIDSKFDVLAELEAQKSTVMANTMRELFALKGEDYESIVYFNPIEAISQIPSLISELIQPLFISDELVNTDTIEAEKSNETTELIYQSTSNNEISLTKVIEMLNTIIEQTREPNVVQNIGPVNMNQENKIDLNNPAARGNIISIVKEHLLSSIHSSSPGVPV